MPARLLRLGLLLGALLLPACTTFLDRAVVGLNGAQKTLVTVHDELAAVHRLERDRAVEEANDAASAKAAALAVHARYAGSWRAYTHARAWWIRVASLVTGARLLVDAGGSVDEAAVRAALTNFGLALTEASAAAAPLTSPAKGGTP